MCFMERLLNNKIKTRRLLLLRKFQYKVRSLKRTKYFLRLCEPKIGDEYALETVFKESIKFLECSYSKIDEETITEPLNRLIISLNNFINTIDRYRKLRKPVPINKLKPCTLAIKDLYHSSRKSKLYLECDSFWDQFGLALIVLYSLK